ncbi:hypothetical protein [Enterovibrio coralii]|uniref:Peptidase C39-like domain-containing protein n=1 Tax=Enterovibrio coralii TaxID=294935 RepID=A0A135I909_9GAMM|nr:hypothetical protein [Enterovibrio coralii]KXF81939.1 hypothetical protein ATN88_18415 [Enterovibrio coralii]
MRVFPDLKQPDGSLYCGPFCLAAMLTVLNRLPIESAVTVKRYNGDHKEFCGEDVPLFYASGDLSGFGKQIYKLTGIITPGEYPDYIEHSGYNSLAAMVHVMTQFGLQAEVIIRDEQTKGYLETVFPVEFELLNDISVPVSLLNGERSTPEGCYLISVIAVNGSLHYILNTANAEWFDSHLAVDDTSWDFIEKWDGSGTGRDGASWVGISLRVFLPTSEE